MITTMTSMPLFFCYDIDMNDIKIDMLRLRSAIEAAWQPDSAYHYVEEKGNPALGQCYVTSRVVQFYFPEAEIVEGEVQTDGGVEKHFWNLFELNEKELHVDLTWQQFPPGSTIKSWKLLSRESLNDSQETADRVNRLLGRVKQSLEISWL